VALDRAPRRRAAEVARDRRRRSVRSADRSNGRSGRGRSTAKSQEGDLSERCAGATLV
jgi:hypothetical protein